MGSAKLRDILTAQSGFAKPDDMDVAGSCDRCAVHGVSKDSCTLQLSGVIIESGLVLLEPHRRHAFSVHHEFEASRVF